VQFRVPLVALLPRYARLNRTPFIILMVTWSLVGLFLAWLAAGVWLPFGIYAATLVPLFAFLCTALWWPLRYGRGALPPQHAFLRYLEANRLVSVPASRAMIDVPTGVFELHHLASLKLCNLDFELDRYGLNFSGDYTPAVLFRWPGVSKSDALEIRQAILDRVDPKLDGEGR